jgi:hypothetical protein
MENNNTILSDEELLKQAQDDENKPLDPDEAAAFFVHEAHTQFRKLGYALAERKKRSLVRVLEAVIFEPLEKVELFGEQEQQLFALCQQIMYNKGVVLQFAMKRFEEKVNNKEEGTSNG